MKKSRMPLETPHPSLLSEGTAYKLPSSVGQHETPRDFSPLPVPTSKRLKENRVKPPPKTYGKYGKKKGSAALESPFGDSSPEKGGLVAPKQPKQATKDLLILGGPLSTVPVLASAPSSPHQRTAARRPSFDAPHTHIDFDLFSPSRDIDFNRPPSQMSLYDYNSRAFDADLPGLAQSTPKHPLVSYDTDTDEEDEFSLGLGGGYETPDNDDDDDWVSDSLISPPKKDKELKEPEPQVLQDLFDSLIILRMSIV